MAARSPGAVVAAAAVAAVASPTSSSPFLSPTPQTLGSSGGTPVLAECPANDDERERRQRRRSRVVDSSLQGLGSPSFRQEGWQPQLPQWTNEQISEHYSTCIKLSTENKITTKNAFGLHLIDYMIDILNQKTSDLTNFQAAAGTLDASAKIYAMRVDSLHADTFRTLGNLGLGSAPARDPDSPEEGSSSAPEAAKRAHPKKKPHFKSIEHDLSKINVSEATRRPEMDPVFQHAIASFDECSSVGIFMPVLRSQNFQSRLLFPSEIIPLPSSESLSLPSSEPVSVPGFKALLSGCVEKRPICSSLAGFRFTTWDEDSHNESVSALLERFKKSAEAFDPNADPEDSEDSEGPPQAEFLPESPDGECRDNGHSLGTLGHSNRRSGAALGVRDVGDIGALSQQVSLNPGEYSYFSPRTLSMWAGPEHWRFLPRKQPAAPAQDSRRRIPRKAFELDFDEDIDFQSHFRKTKASTTLSKPVVEARSSRSTTLPEDFSYDPKNLSQLFLKPHIRVSQCVAPVEILESEAGIEDYDYNNPNDTSNFCPGLQVSDSEDDPDPVGFLGTAPLPPLPEAPEPPGITARNNDPALGELELIAEPHKVHKASIQYARKATRVDMRLLKWNMWDLLTAPGTETGTETGTGSAAGAGAAAEADTGAEAGLGSEAEAGSEVGSGSAAGVEAGAGSGSEAEAQEEEPEEETELKVTGEKLLSEIIRDLRDRLPPAMAADLSVPLALMCLLHLANEKNLRLENTEDLSDIRVSQGDGSDSGSEG